MTRKRLFTLAVVLVLVVPSLATATVTAQEDPNFKVFVAEDTVTPGQVNQLTISMVNTPRDLTDRVTRARNVKVEFREGKTPFTVLTGTKVIGDMRNNEFKTVTARVRVPTEAPAGRYCIPMDITHEFDIKDKLTTTKCAWVHVEERARFQASTVGSTVPVDGTGTVTVEVTNVGEERATNASVTLESRTADLRFGQSATASRFVGSWEPNETKTVEYEITASEDAETRSYTLYSRVNYKDTDGDDATSSQLTVGMTPVPEQTFEVTNVESTLRAGEEGTLSGTVTNEGERPARNAVVVLQTSSSTVTPIETEYAVGTLEPGQSADFDFAIEATSDAEAGPRQFSFVVRYRDVDDEQRSSDTLDVRTTIAEQRDEFDLEPVNATVQVGSSSRLEVRVTNTLDEPVTDVSAKLYTESPLSSDDDEAFVGRLEPGQSTTFVFDLSASGSALVKAYPVQLDFRYEDAGGDTQISDTYQLPVNVMPREQQSSFPLPIVGGVLLLVIVGAGVVLYRRRN